jgi:hypothetical protein
MAEFFFRVVILCFFLFERCDGKFQVPVEKVPDFIRTFRSELEHLGNIVESFQRCARLFALITIILVRFPPCFAGKMTGFDVETG